jgi:hypothetical protein
MQEETSIVFEVRYIARLPVVSRRKPKLQTIKGIFNLTNITLVDTYELYSVCIVFPYLHDYRNNFLFATKKRKIDSNR